MNTIFFDPYVGTIDKYSAESIIRASHEAGYDGFNLSYHPAFMNVDRKLDISKIQPLCQSLELKIHSLLAWGPSVTDPSVEFRQIEEHYRYVLDVCLQLNVPYVSIWPSSKGISKQDAFETLAVNLQKLVPIFSSRNKSILLEFQPVHTPVENVSEALALVDRVSPELKISCDTTHLSNSESNLNQAIHRLKPCLGDIHLSGRHRKSPIIDPCDYEEILKALKEIRFKGPILVQYHLEKDLSTIVENCVFARDLVQRYLTS